MRSPWGFLAAPHDAALAKAFTAALALDADARRRAADRAREWVTLHADVDVETARMSTVVAKLAG